MTFCDSSLTPPQQLTVLCIDDDPQIGLTLNIRLAAHGVRVSSAYYGTQGLLMAVTEKPVAIVTDLHMPQGDGAYVIEWLRRNRSTRNVPVIVLTGRRERGLEREMLNLGATAFFNKPARFVDLLHALGKVVPLISSAEMPAPATFCN